MNALEVNGLKKRFKAVQALNGISFTVPQACVYCILGPNGAGKTTLFRILTTLSRPDSGTATVLGHSIAQQTLAVRQKIGIVAQENRFDRYFSIWHNLVLHAQMHGMPEKLYTSRITALLETVGLYDRRFSKPDDLSGGMQRRIALIRALIHNPSVLFLDEPSTGLDPQARLDIWKTIEQFKQTATVILTTHYMEEADRLSDHLLLMSQGTVVAKGTAQSLKQSVSPTNRYEVSFNAPKSSIYYPKLAQCLELMSGAAIVQLSDFKLQLDVPDESRIYALLETIAPSDILQFGRVEADLETVFLSIGERIGKAEAGKGG